jgi:hypothetical protein
MYRRVVYDWHLKAIHGFPIEDLPRGEDVVLGGDIVDIAHCPKSDVGAAIQLAELIGRRYRGRCILGNHELDAVNWPLSLDIGKTTIIHGPAVVDASAPPSVGARLPGPGRDPHATGGHHRPIRFPPAPAADPRGADPRTAAYRADDRQDPRLQPDYYRPPPPPETVHDPYGIRPDHRVLASGDDGNRPLIQYLDSIKNC